MTGWDGMGGRGGAGVGVRRSDRRASTYILCQVLVDDLLEVLAARVVVLCGERRVARGRDAVVVNKRHHHRRDNPPTHTNSVPQGYLCEEILAPM